MKSYKTLILEIAARKIVLKINRPEALNALNQAVLQELDDCLTEVQRLPFSEAGILILTGVGEKSFVAGADIKEMLGMNLEQAQKFSKLGQAITSKLENLRLPTIAAVNGFALGGGLELALSCDFIYASQNAKLGLPEVSLGLIPGFGGTVRLSKVVGPARAKEMILTGLPLTAEEAHRVGLVNRVAESSQLMAEVIKTADAIVARAPLSLSVAKKLVHQTAHLDTESALSMEASHFAELFSSVDTKEGTKAFTEKRPPQFVGK